MKQLLLFVPIVLALITIPTLHHVSARACTIQEANRTSNETLQTGHPDPCTSLKDFGSEGSNGDFTCVNPNQSGPGCPNDQPTHHHTQAYESGYLYGSEDRGAGVASHALDQCQASDYTGKDLQHCIVGYNDGFNGVIQH